MKTILFANQKGGAGKTTMTSHQSVACDQDDGNYSVAIIDCDPQAGLEGWYKSRKEQTPILIKSAIENMSETLERLAESGVDYTFIDTPPGVGPEIEKLVLLADFVCVPCQPSPNDLRAVGGTISIVKQHKKPFGFIINCSKSSSSMTAQAVASLSAHGQVSPAFICNRVEFASSMIDGRTALETNPKGKGAEEIRELWHWLKSCLEAEEIA